MNERQYIAAKDLVINGAVIPAGKPIPAGTDRERVLNGLRIGSIRVFKQPAAPAATPAAPLPSPAPAKKGK